MAKLNRSSSAFGSGGKIDTAIQKLKYLGNINANQPYT